MEDFKALIKTETTLINLKGVRSGSVYDSPLDDWLERIYQEPAYSDRHLLEFVLCFLEVDPRFFRSGHIKEHAIAKVKRSLLKSSDRQRLCNILLDAARRRGRQGV